MYCNFLKAVDQERVMVLLSLNTFFFQVLVKITWLYLYQCHLNWKCEMKASLQSPDQKKCISKWKRKGSLYFIQSVFLSIPFFFLNWFLLLIVQVEILCQESIFTVMLIK